MHYIIVTVADTLNVTNTVSYVATTTSGGAEPSPTSTLLASNTSGTHTILNRIYSFIQFVVGSSRRPVIYNVSSDWALDIINGNEKVILICIATGEHINGGYWERADGNQELRLSHNHNRSKPISHSHHKATVQMNIAKARPRHSGRYRCIAFNRWGVVESRDVLVTIRSKGK